MKTQFVSLTSSFGRLGSICNAVSTLSAILINSAQSVSSWYPKMNGAYPLAALWKMETLSTSMSISLALFIARSENTSSCPSSWRKFTHKRKNWCLILLNVILKNTHAHSPTKDHLYLCQVGNLLNDTPVPWFPWYHTNVTVIVWSICQLQFVFFQMFNNLPTYVLQSSKMSQNSQILILRYSQANGKSFFDFYCIMTPPISGTNLSIFKGFPASCDIKNTWYNYVEK